MSSDKPAAAPPSMIPPSSVVSVPSVTPAVPESKSRSGLVENIAIQMNPSSFQPGVQQKEIKDEFPYETAFNLAFLGAGQGGARIASSFHSLGYRRVAFFNTAESDFEGLPADICRYILKLGGAAKDAKFAEDAIRDHDEEIFDLLQRAWGKDVDYGLICVSFGGGSGSGTAAKFVQIARAYMESIGKVPRVGVVASIPSQTEGQQICRNALTVTQKLLDLKVSPFIMMDNAKINTLYRPGFSSLYRIANSTISQLLHLFNRLAAIHSEYITFDRSELAQLLDNGIVVMGAADIKNVSVPADVTEAIRGELSNNVLADVDLKTGSKGACLFVASPDVLDALSMEFFEAGFEQLNRTLKGTTPVVHRGVYAGASPGLQAYVMISDLKPPMKTFTALSKQAGVPTPKAGGAVGLAEFLGIQ